ncbi:hypothetical protein ACFLXP_04765 [Chloroflexota bacterium]
MRAENISEEMERTITETWLSMRRLDYEPTAANVRASVVRQLSKEGYSDTELPKLRTFQEYIRRARKRNASLKGTSNIDESLPWYIEILNDGYFYIAPEIVPFILQLWRYCKNLGPELTIRQVKWATRLYYLVKDLDIAEQWVCISRYSREEELSLLSGTQMRTEELNSSLVMQPWEHMTLTETDVKFKANRRIGHTFILRAIDGGIAEEFSYVFADILRSHIDTELDDTLPGDKFPEDANRANRLDLLMFSLPSSSKYFPDFESRMVYLRHLAKLSQLPYWRNAEPEEIYALIGDLRSWVVSQAKAKIKRENNPKSKSLFGYMLGSGGSFPLDIYLRAGFSLDEDTEELEAELKKIHPDWWEKEGDK